MILLTLSSGAYSSENPEVELLHWWSSPGEVAALNVLVEAYQAKGGRFYNSGATDQPSSRKQAIERIAKGYPATFTQWNAGKEIFEFHELGLIDQISDPALVAKLRAQLAPAVLEAVTHDGKVLAIPLGVHSENWMWYANERIRVDTSTLSGDWQGFLEQGSRLAAEEIPLLAVGDQPWQVRILFTSLFLGVSRDAYKRFYLSTDASVTDTESFRVTLKLFTELAKYSRSFGDGNWNSQVAAVADGQAGAVFMGDWAKGEFQSLGKSVGADVGCVIPSAADPSLLIVIDTFILGKVSESNERQGRAMMLDVVANHDTNHQYNLRKGSLSPYAKPPVAQLDVCSEQGYQLLDSSAGVVPPYASYKHGATMHEVDQEIYQLWVNSMNASDDEKLIPDSIEKFRSILLDKKTTLKKKKGKVSK